MPSGSLGIRFNTLSVPLLYVSSASALSGICIPVRDLDNVTEEEVYDLIHAYEVFINGQITKLRARQERVADLTLGDIYRYEQWSRHKACRAGAVSRR